VEPDITRVKMLVYPVILVAFFLTSCAVLTNDSVQQQTPAAPPVDLTPSACAPATPIPIHTPEPSKLLYILIDRSGSYDDWTDDALERLAEVLPLVVGPGDRVIAAWIGIESEHPSEVFLNGSVRAVPAPDMAPAPQPPTPSATPTPIPVPPTPEKGLSTTGRRSYQDRCQEIETKNRAASESAESENREAMNRHFCEVREWNSGYRAAMSTWQQERQSAEEGFLETAIPAIRHAIIEQYDAKTHIHEALYVAARVFNSAARHGAFGEYRLLILSDMKEDRLYPEADLPLNLEGVDVVVAMMFCAKAHQCDQQERAWSAEFQTVGAKSFEFLLVVESTAEVLVPLLR